MRYEIRIEGKRVDLKAGSGYELEMYNPMFDYERPPGARAVDIVLAGESVNNQRILGFPNNPMVRDAKNLYYCEKSLNGNLIEKGYLRLKEAKDDFKMDFVTNLLQFFGEYQQMKLSEIDLGKLALPANWNSTVLNAWNSGGYVLPKIYNDTFYASNPPGGWTGIVNDYAGGSYTGGVKVPMFFLKYVLKKIADLAGVTITGEYWNSVMADSTIIYSTRAMTGLTEIDIRKHLPELTVGGLIMALRKLYNLALFFDVKRKRLRMDFAKDIWTGETTIDWSGKVGKIMRGTPIVTGGLDLSFTLDNGDGLSKDEFFASRVPEGGDAVKVATAFSTLKMEDGNLVAKQNGITPEQADKQFGARLLYSTGAATAGNAIGGVAIKWDGGDGLFENYWKEEDGFRKSGFVIEELMALNAYDIARMGAIFRGESNELPKVHIQGVNYIIEKITVPTDSPRASLVRAWRI